MSARRHAVLAMTAIFVAGAAAAQPAARPDPLLAIDRVRDAVVDRIVVQWRGALSFRQESDLRARLWAARADHLFAATLAQSLADVNAVLADAERESRESMKGNAKAIGDANADLVYTPIAPCRIADTRGAGGGVLLANATRTFDGFSANFSTQGGTASNCGMPNAVAAIAMNVYAVNPSTLGFIKVWAANGAEPAVSTVNYQAGMVAIATGAIVPVDSANSNRFNAKSPAQVDFIADVVGYFAKPNGTPYKQGGNAFGAKAVLGTTDAQALELWQNNLRVVRYETGNDATLNFPANIIAGNASNSAAAGVSGAVIAGGGCNSGANCTPGNANTVLDDFGIIGGGNTNTAWFHGVVGGGFANYAAGSYSVVPGGSNNTSWGAHSFAGGFGANARTSPTAPVPNNPTHGAFVWADSANNSSSADVFYTSANDEFAVRARGGFRLRTGGGAAPATGCDIVAGGGAWSCSSDRSVKEDFAAVTADDVLAKIIAIPITTWRFKGTPAQHMGPMAQDFWAAFGLGENERTISHVDVQGVTLAGIQALSARLDDKTRRIAALERRLADFEDRETEIASLRRNLDAMQAALRTLIAERDATRVLPAALVKP